MARKPCSSCVVGMVLAAGAVSASEPAARPVFPGETSAVVLDVVVRDGHGGVARGLTAADFEVFEDGVRQTLESFQVVARGDAARGDAARGDAARGDAAPRGAEAAVHSAAAVNSAGELVARPEPTVVALVFDRLSPGTRAFARSAALSYLADAHRPGDVVGVFVLDLSLRLVRPFTDDVHQIQGAIERAARLGQTAGDSEGEREEARQRREELVWTERQAEGLVAVAALQTSLLGDTKNREAAAGRALEVERHSRELEGERRGVATTRGLTAIVRVLGGVRGRKTLVLFSEGLAVPSASRGALRGVIDAANRANVSVYAVDTGGLRSLSAAGEARAELARSIQVRARQFTSGGGSAAESALTRGLERNEDVLGQDPSSTLGPLASETGGLLIRDTNDVGRRWREMADDMRFYYILSYTPQNDRPDGRFRKLSVKVRPRGLEVRTRRGYLAPRRAALADGQP